MKSVKRYFTGNEESQINLTPLIDVVFVILIMFIVVAPLLEMDKVTLATSDRHEAAATGNGPITIHVFANNAIALNGKAISLAQLQEELKGLYHTFPHATPQLFHDCNATFGTYQTVKNAVEAAGFAEMNILLKPS